MKRTLLFTFAVLSSLVARERPEPDMISAPPLFDAPLFDADNRLAVPVVVGGRVSVRVCVFAFVVCCVNV